MPRRSDAVITPNNVLAAARDAVDLATCTASARRSACVAQVRADLIPYEDVQTVRDLIDYINEVLPAAA
ncbi:hypothetical protein ACIA5C_46995 [Actinoplanes sp. NPDC051343]|uniref:hypothetical protein n=1 Tax=Actinoplanes sp. NPDC051343 TaxID=3363906 RepID=UPI00378D6D87